MHFHSFFAQSKYHARPLAQTLAAGNTTLAAWSLVGDLLWFDVKTYKQKSVPKPGEALGWFQRELGRIKEHVASQKLRILRAPPDVDRALRGEPHIVLAVEGASFIESGRRAASRPPTISALRHLQLVHYTRSAIGEIQTEPSDRPGLTQVGKQVVGECNRLGILVDLAHCTEPRRDGRLVHLARTGRVVSWLGHRRTAGALLRACLAAPAALARHCESRLPAKAALSASGR